MHSMAYRSMVRQIPNMSNRLKGRVNGKKVASMMRLEGYGPFTADGIGAMALDTLRNFCNSADGEVGKQHVPARVRDRVISQLKANYALVDAQLGDMRQRGVSIDAGKLTGPATDADRAWLAQNRAEVSTLLNPADETEAARDVVASTAAELFDAMQNSDRMPLTHDVYLKLWALSRPQLAADYILFDEAQDASPVMLDLLRHQQASVIYVGDRYQEIYGWRGAVNALDTVKGQSCRITQSFRFGQPIADLASAILNYDLDANVDIRGFNKIRSRVIADGSATGLPDAILGRTNSAVLAKLLALIEDGKRVFLVGGSRDLVWMVESVEKLMDGQPASHPDLADLTSWAELKALVETDSGRDLAPIVRAVEEYGASRLIHALDACSSDERRAEVTVSTAHKAKGRQWPRVQLLGDFWTLKDEEAERQRMKDNPSSNRHRPWMPEDSRIAYVAATRGQNEIDISACRGLRQLYESTALSAAA